MRDIPEDWWLRPKKTGFALLSPERRQQAARNGGKKVQAKGTGHRFTSESAREAGSVALSRHDQRGANGKFVSREGGAGG